MLIATCVRLFIRIRVQKQFAIDDAFILFGIALLTCAMGMLYFFVDEMYQVEALLLNDSTVIISIDTINQSLDFQKWAAVSLIILWFAINSVKLSFLSLFRKLVDRVRVMVYYWWIVLIFTIMVWGYGITTYILPCPTFYSVAACKFDRSPTAGPLQ